MPCIARGSVNLHIPMARDLDRYMRRSSKTIEPQSPSRLDFREPQRPKSNDPRAQKWCSLFVRISFRNRINEILRRNDVLRKATVHGIAREFRRVTQILRARSAVFTRSIRFVQPRYSDALPDAKALGALSQFLDRADYLVPGNHRRFPRWQFAFNHVQVRPANAASMHAHQEFAFTRLRCFNIGILERIRFHFLRGSQNTSLHGLTSEMDCASQCAPV